MIIEALKPKSVPSSDVSAKRVARYKDLQRLSKQELIAVLSRTSRIHSANKETPKSDIITAIIDDEF